MVKLKLNTSKCFVPLSVSRGTVEQRMQKARVLNLKFYDNLQERIKNNEIKPLTFVRTLRDVVGTGLGISIICNNPKEVPLSSYLFDEKAFCKGYLLTLPSSNFSNNIHKNSASKFLKVTQNLLNEAFNPKILRRFVELINTGADIKSINDFYSKHLIKESTLTKSDFEKFLMGKTNKEKIDALQFMRYKLISEQNTEKARYQIDRRIQFHNNFTYERSDGYYDLAGSNYELKLQLLNEELAKVINQERR